MNADWKRASRSPCCTFQPIVDVVIPSLNDVTKGFLKVYIMIGRLFVEASVYCKDSAYRLSDWTV